MAQSLRPLIWFYGAAGAGKTEILNAASEILGGPGIDESAIRGIVHPQAGGSAVDRLLVDRATAHYASMAAEDVENYPGPAVWVATQALFEESRRAIMAHSVAPVIFVLVDTPLSLLRERTGVPERQISLPDPSPAPALTLSGGFSDIGIALSAWLPGLEQLLADTRR